MTNDEITNDFPGNSVLYKRTAEAPVTLQALNDLGLYSNTILPRKKVQYIVHYLQ